MVGETIKHLREQQGLSQNDLAKKAGLGRSTIARIENGNPKYKYDSLEKIANALSTTTASLLDVPGKSSQSVQKKPTCKLSKDLQQFYDSVLTPELNRIENKILDKIDEEITILKEIKKKIDSI